MSPPERGLPAFSFFGALGLARDQGSDSGMPEEEVRFGKALFRRLIDEIDADRTCTCKDAIRRAQRSSNLPFPNPVLDQLFELNERCQRHAVRPLLAILNDGALNDLQRSQAAYLLVAWLRSVSRPLAQPEPLREQHDLALVHVIASEVKMSANLHVRFHVLEIAHELLVAGKGSQTGVVEPAKRLIQATDVGTRLSPSADPLRGPRDVRGTSD